MIVDYWLVRRQKLDLVELYRAGGRYWFQNGFNVAALVAVVVAVAPIVPGFAHAAATPGGVIAHPDVLDRLYTYGWFFTFALAGAVYYALTRLHALGEAQGAMVQET